MVDAWKPLGDLGRLSVARRKKRSGLGGGLVKAEKLHDERGAAPWRVNRERGWETSPSRDTLPRPGWGCRGRLGRLDRGAGRPRGRGLQGAGAPRFPGSPAECLRGGRAAPGTTARAGRSILTRGAEVGRRVSRRPSFVALPSGRPWVRARATSGHAAEAAAPGLRRAPWPSPRPRGPGHDD